MERQQTSGQVMSSLLPLTGIVALFGMVSLCWWWLVVRRRQQQQSKTAATHFKATPPVSTAGTCTIHPVHLPQSIRRPVTSASSIPTTLTRPSAHAYSQKMGLPSGTGYCLPQSNGYFHGRQAVAIPQSRPVPLERQSEQARAASPMRSTATVFEGPSTQTSMTQHHPLELNARRRRLLNGDAVQESGETVIQSSTPMPSSAAFQRTVPRSVGPSFISSSPFKYKPPVVNDTRRYVSNQSAFVLPRAAAEKTNSIHAAKIPGDWIDSSKSSTVTKNGESSTRTIAVGKDANGEIGVEASPTSPPAPAPSSRNPKRLFLDEDEEKEIRYDIAYAQNQVFIEKKVKQNSGESIRAPSAVSKAVGTSTKSSLLAAKKRKSKSTSTSTSTRRRLPQVSAFSTPAKGGTASADDKDQSKRKVGGFGLRDDLNMDSLNPEDGWITPASRRTGKRAKTELPPVPAFVTTSAVPGSTSDQENNKTMTPVKPVKTNDVGRVKLTPAAGKLKTRFSDNVVAPHLVSGKAALNEDESDSLAIDMLRRSSSEKDAKKDLEKVSTEADVAKTSVPGISPAIVVIPPVAAEKKSELPKVPSVFSFGKPAEEKVSSIDTPKLDIKPTPAPPAFSFNISKAPDTTPAVSATNASETSAAVPLFGKPESQQSKAVEGKPAVPALSFGQTPAAIPASVPTFSFVKPATSPGNEAASTTAPASVTPSAVSFPLESAATAPAKSAEPVTAGASDTSSVAVALEASKAPASLSFGAPPTGAPTTVAFSFNAPTSTASSAAVPPKAASLFGTSPSPFGAPAVPDTAKTSFSFSAPAAPSDATKPPVISFGATTLATATSDASKPSFSFPASKDATPGATPGFAFGAAPTPSAPPSEPAKAFTFGAANPTESAAATPSIASFGTPSTGAPAFGFGNGATSAIPKPAVAATPFSFGAATPKPAEPVPSLSFGAASTTASNPPPVFGATQPSASPFGAPQPASSSAFGSATQAASAPSPFGQPSLGQASSVPAFGGNAFGQSASSSSFGGSTVAPAFGQSTAAPAFGQAPAPSPFGGQSSTPAFGSANPPTNPPTFGAGASAFGVSQPPAFGVPQQTTQPSPFGQPSAAAPSTFGGGMNTQPSQPPTFGQPATTGFGAAAPSGGFTFGQPTAAAPSTAAPFAFGGGAPAPGAAPMFSLGTTSGATENMQRKLAQPKGRLAKRSQARR